jgi:hypothetical protein
MIRAVALLLILVFALAAYAIPEHRAPNAGLPLVHAGFQQEDRIVIPWVLNTRCTITSDNLPQRDPERNA